MTTPNSHKDLVFFGAVSASISHEIKNRMAIINEQAGLLEDLVHMAERGNPIDPERLLRLSGKVQDQIARADAIIRNMNRFAHSVDNFRHTADLNDVVDLAVVLCRRKADMQGVCLTLSEQIDSIKISTSPFLLIQLVWTCLEKVMPGAERGMAVSLGCRPIPEGAAVSIGADLEPAQFEAVASDSSVRELIDLLGANVSVDAQASQLVFNLPANPDR